MIVPSETSTQRPDVQSAAVKERKLRSMMRDLGRVLVAYSGGVDSSYLAAVANDELKQNALCVTGISASVSEIQRRRSSNLARQLGFNFRVVVTNEFADPEYLKNGTDRCFYCKDELYSVLQSISTEFGDAIVLDGTNADDLSDHRPGRTAARQRNVRSPLAETGFTKLEIRERSKALGLPTWDLPASPCLSSRIAHGVPVTIERLGKVEKAEKFLGDLGFVEYRVRVHDELARVEISKNEMTRILNVEIFELVESEISKLGFKYVTLDMQGFRSGSMNHTREAAK